MNRAARLEIERQLIREAAGRLIDGTARHSSGQLNIVALAQESGISRTRLYEQHADLVAGFKAKTGLGHLPPDVRALQGQLAAASQRISELQTENRHLEQRIQTLTAIITELTLDTTPGNVIPLRG
jgi:chromosome segregation ATPase